MFDGIHIHAHELNFSETCVLHLYIYDRRVSPIFLFFVFYFLLQVPFDEKISRKYFDISRTRVTVIWYKLRK